MSKAVLITGISGFVGSYLAKHLLDLGNEVHGLIRRKSDGQIPRSLSMKGIDGGVSLLEGDLTDLTSLLFAIDKCEPDVIFHLGAQSFVPRSFLDPLETFRVNSNGTQNLLEAARLKDKDCKIIFAGSSEEYGVQFASQRHYEETSKKMTIFPEPDRIPELPVDEKSHLRPVSPYATSKVFGDFMMRNYHATYGMDTIVSRGFNHEGAGRGKMFVTSAIIMQCVRLRIGELKSLKIGNVNAFRDWSHVEDIVNGYSILADKGKSGDVYVQGSMRTNSVLTYMLLALDKLGYSIDELKTSNERIMVRDPLEVDNGSLFGVKFKKTKVDRMMLNGDLEFTLKDRGIALKTNKGDLKIDFEEALFRPSDVPILLCNNSKISGLGFKATKTVDDIVNDQINYYMSTENRIN